MKTPEVEPIELHWNSLTATATNKRKIQGKIFKKESFEIRILNGVSGFAKPGSFTAIMGPSGNQRNLIKVLERPHCSIYFQVDCLPRILRCQGTFT